MPGATSAVMEMCLDNPREGFGELFDTHPTVEARVAALVKFAGGHDPGPIALPPQGDEEAAAGPWGSPESAPDGDSGAALPSPSGTTDGDGGTVVGTAGRTKLRAVVRIDARTVGSASRRVAGSASELTLTTYK